MAQESYATHDRPLAQRLRDRKISSRQWGLYAVAVIVLILAEPMWPTFIVGLLFVVTGLMIRVWTFGHLEKDRNLTTTGPYAHSRNPAYFGSLMILIGIALAAGNTNSIVGIVLWLAGIIGVGVFLFSYMPRKYRREYTRLKALFPQEERRHATHVPHFWPRLTPWHSGDERRFYRTRLRRNHERGWAGICTAALILMWL